MELDKIRFYERTYTNWWVLAPNGFGENIETIVVNIQGDKQGPTEKWLSFAQNILSDNWDNVIKLTKDRLRIWAEYTDKDYVVESIYFGEYPYGPEQSVHCGFKITLKTDGSDCDDVYGEFTINFNENIWPIGYEFSIA